jgi:hypothetical protein
MKVSFPLDHLIVRLVLAGDLVLALCEDCLPTHNGLPLGGSHVAQLGILFTVSFLLKEAFEFFWAFFQK